MEWDWLIVHGFVALIFFNISLIIFVCVWLQDKWMLKREREEVYHQDEMDAEAWAAFIAYLERRMSWLEKEQCEAIHNWKEEGF